MNPWGTYCSRIEAKGGTKRESILRREYRNLTRRLPGCLAYQSMTIDNVLRNVAVINSDNFNMKTLCSMPGEDLPHGGMVSWMDNHWLIVARDANNEVYVYNSAAHDSVLVSAQRYKQKKRQPIGWRFFCYLSYSGTIQNHFQFGVSLA